jgi:hypothetical protein
MDPLALLLSLLVVSYCDWLDLRRLFANHVDGCLDLASHAHFL